jgi:hypothetical protein
MADFISTMTKQKALKDRAARQEAARQANIPGATGYMTDTPDTLKMKLSGLIAEGLMKLGMSGRGAYDLGTRTTNVAESGTPLGMLTGMEDVARAEDPREAALAAMGLLMPVKGFHPAAPGKSAELFHMVGGGPKLREPFSAMTSTTRATGPMRPDVEFSPEQIPMGSYILPLYGDRTMAGRTLTHVGDRPLTTAQQLGGGGRFMQENPGDIWASEQGRIKTMADRVRELEQASGMPVYGTHVSMGPLSGDFAKMTAQPMLQMTDPSKIGKDVAKAFDEAAVAEGVKSWPGIYNVNPEEWLASAPGGERANLAKVMQQSQFQKEPGFANVAAIRKAITEPELLNTPTLTSGMSIGRFAPGGQVRVKPPGGHETYSTHIGGEHVGNIGQMPFELMFPDFLRQYTAKHGSNPKAMGVPNIGRTVELKMPEQKVTQQWLEEIMPYWLTRGSE